jgi:hypothetical protein
LRAVSIVAGALLIHWYKKARQGVAMACTLVAIDAFIQDVSSKWPEDALGCQGFLAAAGLKNAANGVIA